MDLFALFSLQGTLFTMMLIGAWLKKRGVIDENGKRCLTDLCVNIIIPCNIFQSCLIEFNMDIFRACALLLLSAVLLQGLCLLLNRFLFNRYPPQRKKVLQYCTIVPMSGFLGNPIAEGLYDSLGAGTLLGLDTVALGVSVLMTGMPAGATAAIFAARYGSDADFATRCVVFTNLVSMVTLPLWCYLVG